MICTIIGITKIPTVDSTLEAATLFTLKKLHNIYSLIESGQIEALLFYAWTPQNSQASPHAHATPLI